MNMDLSQFYATFFDESNELLEEMESTLLNIDLEEYDNEEINNIFRAAHSIKGGAATFGFNDISDFTHKVENFLDLVRSNQHQLSQDNIDLLLQSVDAIRDMIATLQAGETIDSSQTEELTKQLKMLLKNEVDESANITGRSNNTEQEVQDDQDEQEDLDALFDSIINEENSVGSSVEEVPIGFHITFIPNKDIFLTGNDPLRFFRDLQKLGNIDVSVNVDKLPNFNTIINDMCYLSWEIDLVSDCTKDDIKQVFDWVIDDSEIIIEPLKKKTVDIDNDKVINSNIENNSQVETLTPTDNMTADANSVAVNANQSTSAKVNQSDGNKNTKIATNTQENNDKKPIKATAVSKESASIRVDTEKIDDLINMVGELVITQSMLGQIGSDFNKNKVGMLRAGLTQLEQNSRQLQECVMKIRMLPISSVFNRYPRVVRDLAKKVDKKVNLSINGEHTELDKSVLEKIGDPMIHLIRNAIDHGIEFPDERIAAGKAESGELQLNAYHSSGNIIIEIVDDGKGLNKKKIIEMALANKVISENEILNDDQVNNLIFQPGFSTAEVVSDVSGRGVGMDVVYKNITALGGRVDIQSTEGLGSTFRISLPLTLAILDGQLLRVDNEILILPLVNIIESIKIESSRIHHISGQTDLYRLREELIPIYDLNNYLNFDKKDCNYTNRFLIIVESEGKYYGLVVDELLSQQQVVIKSLERNYKKVNGITGATILGDGTVSHFDIIELISFFSNYHSHDTHQVA